ncbi:MAG: DoxX family protein [Pseudomonadota bacterium]
MISPALHGVGRVLLALYFLVPGIMKIPGWEDTVAMVARHNVPFPDGAVGISIVVNIIGALLLITNRHVRFTALGFVAYTLVVNALLHDFWNFKGIEAAHEMQNFVKNLGIVAGLLVLAGSSARRSLDVRTLLQRDPSLVA